MLKDRCVADGPHPGPSTTPRVALDENILRCCPGCTDTIDGSLIQVENERLVHVVVLVVGVPDNLGVGGEELGSRCPIRLEAGNVGDDFVIVAAYFGGLHVSYNLGDMMKIGGDYQSCVGR